MNQPATVPRIIHFPEDDLFLNDLAASGDDLYISVTNSGRIYKMDISGPSKPDGLSPELWLEIVGPNGIIIDNNIMYVASYPADGNTTDQNVIYKVGDLSNPEAEVLFNVPGQYDGIALSTDKETLYISNWTPAEVIAIGVRNGMRTRLSLDENLTGPADMTLTGGKLYIPDLPNSRVLVHDLK